jgi:hypothetical protein
MTPHLRHQGDDIQAVAAKAGMFINFLVAVRLFGQVRRRLAA